MDALTEMKEHITREERIEEEKDLMIDNFYFYALYFLL